MTLKGPPLPRQRKRTDRTGARERPAAKPVGPKLRILIAEDNHDSGQSLRMVLDAFGYEAHLVGDGNAAVEAAAALEPDVILMDIGLPVLNGYEATRRIRAHSRNPALRIIALTGWGKLDDLKMAAQAGIDHHFLKPLDFPRLRELLDSFLPKSRSPKRSGARTEESNERRAPSD
jgi:CheY-like chemotaxis protein